MVKIYVFFALLIINSLVLAQTNQLTISNQKSDVIIRDISNTNSGTKAIIDTLHYDGNNFDGIGTGSAGTYEAYAFFSAAQLAPYNSAGNTITSVDIFVKGVDKVASTTIKFRATQTTTAYSQAFTATEGWNNIVLTTPFPIPATNLYIGYECVALSGGFPLGCDAGPVNTNGNWIVYGASWGHLTDLNAAMTYNWNIRARVNGVAGPSTDAKLSALNVNGSGVTGFSPNTYTYNVVLPYGSALPVVTATTNHASATKVITNATSLPGTATVVVTAEDATTTLTYTINFTIAAPSTDATLSNLLVNGTTVAGFNANVYSYNIVYPFGTTTLPIVTATTSHASATKVISNITGFPGTATVVVTAQDGTTILTYSINFSVTPPSSVASLSSLLVNGVAVNGFSPSVYSYNVVLPYGTTSLPVVTATATDANANIVITNITGLPGTATVVVTAQDGTTILTYSINFSVAPNNDAKLSALYVNGTLVNGFSSTVYDYNVILPYGTTVLPIVTADLNDVNANKVINNATVLPGSASVIVTAEDGTTTLTYTINFTIALSVEELSINSQFAYPSPTNDLIYIPCKNNTEVTVTDITGKLILKTNITSDKNQISLKGNEKGTYIIQTKINGIINYSKIILE